VLGQLGLDAGQRPGRSEGDVEVRRSAAVGDVQALLQAQVGEAPEAGDPQAGRIGAPGGEGGAHERRRGPGGVRGDRARARGPQLPLRARGELRVRPGDVLGGEGRHQRVGEAHRVLAAGMDGAGGQERRKPRGQRFARAAAHRGLTAHRLSGYPPSASCRCGRTALVRKKGVNVAPVAGRRRL